MELSSLLQDLHCLTLSSEKSSSSTPLPPITDVLPLVQGKLIGHAHERFERISAIGQVEQLFKTATPDWLFSLNSDDQQDGCVELNSAYKSFITTLIGCGALPLCEDDCSSLSAAAYKDVPDQATVVSSALTALLEKWEKGRMTELLLAVAPHICVFAVTHCQDQDWTSYSSRTAAQRLLRALLRTGNWTDSAHLLMGEKEEQKKGIVQGVLDVLQPQLTKDTWQQCEAVKLVFSWTLLNMSQPSLSIYLPRFLPPSLLFNDHYRPENCILGVRCLHHIVLNTTAAELRQFNRADVLYQALIHHLYTTEAAVIQPVLSCLLDLLLVLEKPPSSLRPLTSLRNTSFHDSVLRLLLTNMEVEHKVVLRRVYASALPGFIDRMGVAICRHLKRVERVVLGYLEVADPPDELTRLKILEVLEKTTKVAWPRVECRVNVLLRCLLQLLVNVSSDQQLAVEVKHQLMDQSSACIRLLDACSHGRVQHLLQQVDSSCCNSEMLSSLATVTTCSASGDGTIEEQVAST